MKKKENEENEMRLEEVEDEDDQVALMKALELSMAQPDVEQGMSQEYSSLSPDEHHDISPGVPHEVVAQNRLEVLEPKNLTQRKSDSWIHTIDNGQFFEGM